MISLMEKLVSPQQSRPWMICHSSGLPPFDLSGQRKQFLLELFAGIVHCIAHLHGRALRADAGERQINRGVRRLHANLLLRNLQCLRRNDTKQIVRSLADLRRVVLNGHRTARIHCRHRIGSAAALRTMAEAERHASPAHPTRACGG